MMPESADQIDAILQQQISYYQARAAEYDEWFLRQGRYDHGPELNARWFADVAEVVQALHAFAPQGRILEIAAGTGLWTERLARYADTLTALDSSPETLTLNQARVNSPNVTYIEADIFSWQPPAQYDTIFFSFWLSHVPPERFAAFWRAVQASLAPHGRVFLIDSLYEPSSTARDHQLNGPNATTVTRSLNTGEQYEIVKVFYTPETLASKLAAIGWPMDLRATSAGYFLYGSGQPA